MADTEYHKEVAQIEGQLLKCAKRSFDSSSPTFVDGTDIFSHFSNQWQSGNKLRLKHRTPLQLERDRILYSQGMRKQTEKYHVLYNGQRRIVRAYATHTMKMAQVARAISRGLGLNQDFAEAIALGAKVGAVPFIHASKQAMSQWASAKVASLDGAEAKVSPRTKLEEQQLKLDFGINHIPEFVSNLKSSTIVGKIRRYMPWAAGHADAKLYSSGQESYWLLCTNPFSSETKRGVHFPETMYGIWRHTRGLLPKKNPFYHRCSLPGSDRGYNELNDSHATFEWIVVQYADDITWAIENLNDANDVALLNNQSRAVYDALADELSDIDPMLQRALAKNDAGGIYTYFISDFVRHSGDLLRKSGNDDNLVKALSEGSLADGFGLSQPAEILLDKMVKFLNECVFIEPRTKNRTEMLRSVSTACVELIYSSQDVLPRVVDEQARLGRWSEDTRRTAKALLEDPIHRVQLSLDVLASWGDQEIYDFVGIQAL